MYEPHRSKTGRTTNLASCIVATVFLLFLAAGIVVVYFLFFKPKDPKIAVDAVQFPTFSVANGTVDFTFLHESCCTEGALPSNIRAKMELVLMDRLRCILMNFGPSIRAHHGFETHLDCEET
ncbi:hypothetical protein RJ640_012831 [Escallonia rubra]|uniref:Late embryogenesis abundant protein LEA-2 subgroup domain-containing protein n=1 Tax=Escallonia rubra TaxID=112253 RepID=A0AA88S2E7_9ASTE|nr:hypothetical protein RJ640_012831 [Escallonia rubra]